MQQVMWNALTGKSTSNTNFQKGIGKILEKTCCYGEGTQQQINLITLLKSDDSTVEQNYFNYFD